MPNRTPPPHFLVFVPGYMGSRLRSRRTGELVWIDFPALFASPARLPQALDALLDQMRYPNDDLEPAGVVDEVLFVPPLFKQQHYGRLFEHLASLGYDLDPAAPAPQRPPLYTFAYDWRQDNRLSARQLSEAVDRWRAQNPGAEVWLMGHSNGGIVARWYIEKEGGKDHATRLFLLGSPWDGAPKSLHVIRSGLDVLFTRLLNLFDIPRKTRDIIRTFPSVYQLVPQQRAFLKDVDNAGVDPFANTGWLDTVHERQLLLQGRQFNQELGTTLSVETLCFFGTRTPTTSSGLVRFAAGGRWSDITWDTTEAGDGTVPEYSAVHPQATEKLPFAVSHGDIYVAGPVLEKLEWELTRKYRAGVLAEAEGERIRVRFEPEADVYAPGAPIAVWATVHDKESGVPIRDAAVSVRLLWHEALPYRPATAAPPPSPAVPLPETRPGRFEGRLSAPETQGYYRLEATITAPGEPALTLDELLLVEAAPTLEALEAAAAEETFAEAAPPAESSGGELEEAPPETAAGSAEPETSAGDEPVGGAPADDEAELSIPPDLLPRPPAPPPPAPSPPAPPAPEPAPPTEWELDFGFATPRNGGRTGAEFPRDAGFSGSAGGRTARDEPEMSADDELIPVTAGGEEATAPEDTSTRWLNATIADHDLDQPLQLGEIYTLAFGVNTQAGVAAALLDSGRIFTASERLVELTAIARSDDFHVYTVEPQRIFLPRGGKSKNKARFDVEPRHTGEGTVSVAFYKYNNFIQDMTLRLRVGGDGNAIVAVESVGRGPDVAFPVEPRDLSLVIKGQGPFDVTLVDTGVATATLNLTLVELDRLIADVRKTLHEIVFLPSGCADCYVYQQQTAIPEEVHKEALKRLAETGWLLFQDIFYNPANDAGARLIGDRLRQLAQQHTLKIQIVSDRFLLPWGVLYLENPTTMDEIDPGAFLGFGHILEQIPLQQNVTVLEPNILSEPSLSVSVNFNADIDHEMSLGVIAEQEEYWDQFAQAGTTVTTARDADTLFQRLQQEDAADQILYFYCHAGGGRPDEGPNSAYLGLGGGRQITLRDLRLRAGEDKRFAGSPLVFVNACETAELSPFFYGGFMPYFTARGARGFIGTECEVPAVFAAAWARAFFDHFLAGNRSLGETFLTLRRRFLREENNLLGLLYALYCDGDIRVLPGVSRPAPAPAAPEPEP
jgi:hypothetical protein